MEYKMGKSPSEEITYRNTVCLQSYEYVCIKLQLTGLFSKYSSIFAWSFSCISGFRASRYETKDKAFAVVSKPARRNKIELATISSSESLPSPPSSPSVASIISWRRSLCWLGERKWHYSTEWSLCSLYTTRIRILCDRFKTTNLLVGEPYSSLFHWH